MKPYNMGAPQMVTYVVVEKGMEHKGEQKQALMQALELMWLARKACLGTKQS